MNRAVVLGGSGFIGGHVLEALVEEGYETISVDWLPPRFPLAISDDQYKFVQADVSGTTLDRLLAPDDVVFHLASTSLPESSHQDMLRDLTGTVGLMIPLLQSCIKARIKRIIYMSSGGTVYGQTAEYSITEDHATDPACAYGIGKLTCEKYLGLFHRLFGLEHTILRVANAYGERQDPSGRQGVIAVGLGRILNGMPIEVWGDGETVRDFVHVSDVARACVQAAKIDSEYRLFNIGTNLGVSLNELLEKIRQTLNIEMAVTFRPARGFDVPRVVLNSSRAARYLQWSPSLSLEEGLKLYCDWLRVTERFRAGVSERRSEAAHL